MSTTLVNLRDRKGCDTLIDRTTAFGNPHTIGYCSLCNVIHDRISCVEAYRIDFYNKIEIDEEFRKKIQSLKGHSLGCWCVPHLCHGMVILEYLEGISYKTDKTKPPEFFV